MAEQNTYIPTGAQIETGGQTNTGWSVTWNAAGRYPMVGKRRFLTYDDALIFVNDVTTTATATEGLIITVVNDPVSKLNGVYWVKHVANTDAKYGPIRDKGELIKVGGADVEIAENYTEAKELAATLIVGQLIKVKNAQAVVEGSGENTVTNNYKAGFYIVTNVVTGEDGTTTATIEALDTSSGANDAVADLKQRFESYVGTNDVAVAGKAETSYVNQQLGLVNEKIDAFTRITEEEIEVIVNGPKTEPTE